VCAKSHTWRYVSLTNTGNNRSLTTPIKSFPIHWEIGIRATLSHTYVGTYSQLHFVEYVGTQITGIYRLKHDVAAPSNFTAIIAYPFHALMASTYYVHTQAERINISTTFIPDAQ